MLEQAGDGTDLMRRTILAAAAAVPALAAAGLAGAAESAATADGELPPDLAKAVSDYDQATFRNDIATLAEVVADDYILVNSDSTLQDKASYLADFTVPGFRLDPYVIKERVVKVWGGTALIGGLLPLSWTLDGEHHRRLLRVAYVWIRQGDAWRMTYTQLTRVPSSSS